MEVQQQSQPPALPCWSNIVKQHQQQSPPPPPPSHFPVVAAEEQTARVGSCKSAKGIAVAVVDANAIIQGGGRLAVSADRFVSVPEVISEIRDPTSRHSLNFLPFDVDTIEPFPDALKKVISFARATGDLQTLSDVDLKLIALTYMLEAQIHGTQHLRGSPPPIHTVNVKRLPEKDLPGWGSNVPNLEEWEALEQSVEDGSNPNSRILPLKDLNLNVIPADQQSLNNGSTADGDESPSGNQEDADGGFRKSRRYLAQKKEVKIEGKKMVADGIDASQGQFIDDDAGDWRPAVSRSTHRRFLRRKARCEMYGLSSEKDDQHDETENMKSESLGDTQRPDLQEHKDAEEDPHVNLKENEAIEEKTVGEDISTILSQMRLVEESLKAPQDGKELNDSCEELNFSDSKGQNAAYENGEHIAVEGEDTEVTNQELENFEVATEISESVDASHPDDNSSEQSWMLRSLSDSSVACVTGDFAMQNVLLQMGLRLLAPGGMQIRELHRWVLKCHACYKVTTEIGRIFCPSCGNGGTLRKVAVTVGENGIVVAARRPRVSLRGTKFSLPLPQGGRDAITKNPVLREDQLPNKFLYPKTKKITKQGDDDIFASSDIFLHHTDKRAPLQPPIRKTLAVFSQKRNPNDNHYSRAKH